MFASSALLLHYCAVTAQMYSLLVERRQGDTGRAAQRRRTRAAIVDAATRLLAEGRTPSVDDVAAAADVSRRTVYMYFPTLDQLLLDAAVGALSARTVDAAVTSEAAGDDVIARIDALVSATVKLAPDTLPLGRKIIKLTVDAPTQGEGTGAGKRGYRRIQWIEHAVEPLRGQLSQEQFDRLVSALALVIGWEAQIVLQDVRGLDPVEEERVVRWAARTLLKAMIAEALP
jgi:AcrR family transcriptional regulator